MVYSVFDKNRATEHERTQQQRAPGAVASSSKRRQPDTGSSMSPPSKHGSQSSGAQAVTAPKWAAGDKASKVRFSADGEKVAIGPHVYDFKKFGVDVKAKAPAAKQAKLLKCAATFMLNEGSASTKQRLVYAPVGTVAGVVSGNPFAGFKSSDYYRPGEKADFA